MLFVGHRAGSGAFRVIQELRSMFTSSKYAGLAKFLSPSLLIFLTLCTCETSHKCLMALGLCHQVCPSLGDVGQGKFC